jgi:hypothetical protein
MTDITATWQNQLTRATNVGVYALTFKSLHEELRKFDAFHPYFGIGFRNAVNLVIDSAMSGQPVLAKAFCQEVSGLARIVAEAPEDTTLDHFSKPNVAAVAVMVLESWLGWAPHSQNQFRGLAARLAALTPHDDDRAGIILALLVLGRTDEARAVRSKRPPEDRRPGPPPLDPFVEALLEDVDRARASWPRWFDEFIAKNRANELSFHDLLFVARLLAEENQSFPAWLREHGLGAMPPDVATAYRPVKVTQWKAEPRRLELTDVVRAAPRQASDDAQLANGHLSTGSLSVSVGGLDFCRVAAVPPGLVAPEVPASVRQDGPRSFLIAKAPVAVCTPAEVLSVLASVEAATEQKVRLPTEDELRSALHGPGRRMDASGDQRQARSKSPWGLLPGNVRHEYCASGITIHVLATDRLTGSSPAQFGDPPAAVRPVLVREFAGDGNASPPAPSARPPT